MPENTEETPCADPVAGSSLQIDTCGTSSILGSYVRAFNLQGKKPVSVVVHIRHLMEHVDLEAELADAREALGLTENQLVIGSIERDDRVLAAV